MKRVYSYEGDPKVVFAQLQTVLDSLEYEVDYKIIESRTLVTKQRKVRKDVRRYDYSLVIEVTDWIEVTVTGGKYVYKRDSETAIAGKSMTEFHAVDRFPYSLQVKIFEPLEEEFGNYGWVKKSS
ncbi:MAG: hypothetical protein GXO90_07970 [FCB group bacterium]|nr:hypothetical protein [FCB group bacterium]